MTDAGTRPCDTSIAVSTIESVNDFTPYPYVARFTRSVASNRSSRLASGA